MEQGSTEWFEARKGKLTASKASVWVFDDEITDGAMTYILTRLGEIKTGEVEFVPVNQDMIDGTENEPKARFFYEKTTGNKVEEVGFVTHPELDYLGGSIDGRVFTEGVRGHIEIKCPALRNVHIHLKNCLIDSPKAFKKYNKLAYWQAVANMAIDPEAMFCDFISFYPYLEDKTGLFIFRLMRDEKECEKAIGCAKKLRAKMLSLSSRLGIEMPETTSLPA